MNATSRPPDVRDDMDAARGIVLACAASVVLWLVVAAIACAIYR